MEFAAAFLFVLGKRIGNPKWALHFRAIGTTEAFVAFANAVEVWQTIGALCVQHAHAALRTVIEAPNGGSAELADESWVALALSEERVTLAVVVAVFRASLLGAIRSGKALIAGTFCICALTMPAAGRATANIGTAVLAFEPGEALAFGRRELRRSRFRSDALSVPGAIFAAQVLFQAARAAKARFAVAPPEELVAFPVLIAFSWAKRKFAFTSVV
jgi:hypothetical protein